MSKTNEPVTQETLRSVEIFAGAGGLMCAAEEAGFECVMAIEKDAPCCRTLKANAAKWPNAIIRETDIRSMNWENEEIIKDIALLSGGPPCQPFSVGGKRKRDQDSRNLWPETKEAVRGIRPKTFVFENVAGLTTGKCRDYFHREVILGLEALGYHVSCKLTDAVEWGVPQRRRRVFLVGLRKDIFGEPFQFPTPPANRGDVSLARVLERHPGIDPAVDIFPRSSSSSSHREGRQYRGHCASRKEAPSKAIKAGVHGVPGGENQWEDEQGRIHRYTVRQAAAIQDFPDDWIWQGSHSACLKQIGNAVPRRMIRPILEKLKDRLLIVVADQ